MSNTDESRKRFEEMFKNATFISPFQEWPQSSAEQSQEHFDFKFNFKPREVKNYLDRFIIGQNEAKKVLSIAVCDHYNHAQQEQEGNKLQNYMKQNVLLLGPTGVGKTYLVRCLADLIGVPFVKADATKFSETGYVGQDVDDLVRQLIDQANGNIELAQYGIIYLDEVDKIASPPDSRGRDVSGRGVQSNLLTK
jgi:ATP-dependent Clp protease ATP-binding subunit ClpX